MKIKYWAIHTGVLRKTEIEKDTHFRNLGNLAYHLAVGDGILRTRYNTITRSAHISAIGCVQSVEPEEEMAAIDLRPANFEIVPGPNGRRHWEKKPYFILNVKRAREYNLPEIFAKAFANPDWLNFKIGDAFPIRNATDVQLPTLNVQEGFVYLMKWEDEYKIGKAVDVERRQKRIEQNSIEK